MKRVLLAFTLFCALFQVASAQTSLVAGSNVLDNTGAKLSSGQWCFGTSCLTVTAGAFSGTVTQGTGPVTVTNGGATTYLTVPNVTIAGSYFSWDTYVVPSNGNIYGIGVPRVACTPGALYSQTDGNQNHWQCISQNGSGSWNGLPAPGSPNSFSIGTVTTLAPGAPATAVNVGTSGAPVVNLGIPQGYTGCVAGSTCANVLPLTGGTATGPVNAPQTNGIINPCADGAACNGTTDDTATLQNLLNTYAGVQPIVIQAGKTMLIAGVLSIPTNATLGLNMGTLKFTGSGGGACSAGANGLIQMFGFSSTVQGPGYINTASSTANCLFNVSSSSFATGNTVKLVQSTTATSTHQIGAYVANQASVLIDNNEWSQFYPASATIGIIDIPGTVNAGTISANNFQLTGETIGVYPSISVTGQTTSLTIGGEKQGNLCELGYCVYVNEPAGSGGIDVNSIKIDHNYVENGGTSGPDINLAGGVSGAEVGYNYMVGGTVGIQIGSSGGIGANPLATRVIGNIITSQPNAIIDYGSASAIESNTVNGAATTGLTENGSASIFGNIFTSSPVVLNSTGNYVGVNTYYAGSLTCPNGGNIIFDTGITPNANCTGMVATPTSFSINGPIASTQVKFSGANQTALAKYYESTWTPTFTGLTVVNGTGGATYSGTYKVIGNMVFYDVTITTTGTATTSSTTGTTNFTLPLTPVRANAGMTVQGGNASDGVGTNSATGLAWPPSWSALNGTILITGSYQLD